MTDQIVPDSEHRGLVARLPQGPRDLAMLARFDRPIGWWLLFWPCFWGVALAAAELGSLPPLTPLIAFAIGALAMRGAGCTYNDIVDRALDAQVARTALRPLPCGSGELLWLDYRVEIPVGTFITTAVRIDGNGT